MFIRGWPFEKGNWGRESCWALSSSQSFALGWLRTIDVDLYLTWTFESEYFPGFSSVSANDWTNRLLSSYPALYANCHWSLWSNLPGQPLCVETLSRNLPSLSRFTCLNIPFLLVDFALGWSHQHSPRCIQKMPPIQALLLQCLSSRRWHQSPDSAGW